MAAFGGTGALSVPDDHELGRSGWREMQEAGPAQILPVFRQHPETGLPVESHLSWGPIPHYADRRPDFRPIHARAETISERRIFSEAYRKRRCIVPMNSFYLKDARRKRHAISRVDGDVFGVAGIWENWRNPGPTVLLGDNRTTYNCWERSRNLDNSGDRRQTAAPHTPSWSRRLILRFPCPLKTATDKSPPGVTAPAGFRTVEMRYIACPSSSATTPCRP
jgi:hypothetical protein